MLVLVSYDVSTIDTAGKRRLRRVAKKCLDFGIRVQNSVFECNVEHAQWVALKHELLSICDLELDSLRFYYLGNKYQHKVEHHGAKPTPDVEGTLMI